MKVEGGRGILSGLGRAIEKDELFKSKAQSLEKNLANYKNIKGKDGIKTAAKGFESIFLYQMLQQMRKTVPENSLFGKSMAEDVFNSMFDEKIADRIADRGTFGIGSMLEQQLNKKYDIDAASKNETHETAEKELLEVASPKSAVKPVSASLHKKVNNYTEIIEEAAITFQLDPDLIKAVIAKESSGDVNAVSKAGAKGLMQLMDGTANDMGVKDVFNPRENILGGAKYLKQQLVQNDGDLELALAAYNAGPGTVKLYDGIPPYKETQNYVKKVVELQRQFRIGE